MDAQVVVAGGGPVGLGLAIELGQRGIRVIVVERHATPLPIPRGQNLTQRTMEHFQSWHIEKQLRDARTVPAEYGIGGMTTYKTLLSDHHYNWMQRELVRPYYNADMERLPQYKTEAVLRARAAEIDCIEILYGWSATGVSQDGEGADLVITHRESGETRTLRSVYVVGCDGAHSTVREQGGITQTRSDHDRKMVLLVFRSTELHTLLERYPGKSFYKVLHPDLNGYWKFFGRVDLGSTWFFHAPVPEGTTKDNHDFRAMLFEAVGAEFAVEFEHIGFWDLRVAIADSYRNGRVFVAGDAAHSHPPYGGYGINTGLEDARNLGWKLAAVLQGWCADGLLDSYDAERRPVFASTARDFIEKSIEEDRAFVAGFDPQRDRAAFDAEWAACGSGARGSVNAFEPHYSGSPVVWGGVGEVCSAVGNHSFAAQPGHHLAPMKLASGEGIYDALGGDFTLLAIESDAGGFEAAAAGLGLKLRVLHSAATPELARYGARLVLIRPDRFVAWVGDAVPQDAAAVLRRVRGG